MNTLSSTVTGRHEHPPQHLHPHPRPLAHPLPERERPRPVRHIGTQVADRVSPLDRLALHLGVALITWGRRPHAIRSREQVIRRSEQHRAQGERERSAERALLLLTPYR